MCSVMLDCDVNNTTSRLVVFSQRVQSRERRCVKPAQKASPSKVSRGPGSFQSSFSKRPSSSVICLILESWQLWSFCWQVKWTEDITCKQIYRESYVVSKDNDVSLVWFSEYIYLSAGEHQQPHFPGLTRGLVAVLLYWDGKLCVANSLRTLIQSRHGKTFTLDLR